MSYYIQQIILSLKCPPFNFKRGPIFLLNLFFTPNHHIVNNLLTHLYRPLTQYPGGPVDAPVKAAAKRLGVPEEQILLAWSKAKGAVVLTYVFSIDSLSPG